MNFHLNKGLFKVHTEDNVQELLYVLYVVAVGFVVLGFYDAMAHGLPADVTTMQCFEHFEAIDCLRDCFNYFRVL